MMQNNFKIKLNTYKKHISLIFVFHIICTQLFSANIEFNIETEEDYGAVWITGTFDGWTGWGLELTNTGNYWTGSMNLGNGDYEYVILGVDTNIPNWWNDIWNNSTTLNAPLGSECDFSPGDEWQNYGFNVNNNDVFQEYCAGTCNNNCGNFNGYSTTFIIDMSEETVVSGNNDEPIVYLVGTDPQFNGPSGIPMIETENNQWETTINLLPGTYTYKFRNGFYDYWDSPGWESISGDCTVGEWDDRQISISNNTEIVGPFCFNSCTECDSGPEEYVLVWSDEFNDNNIDLTKWTFETGNGNWGWGNGEHQYYTSREENAFIEDGKLVIQALYENYNGYNYTSARMKTVNQGDWVYGKVKARIKVPSGDGTWPAFWMMPTNSVYGGWPNSGEIDIMEHYGCDHLENHPEATVHNNIYNWNGGIPPTSHGMDIPTATSDFHEYELQWTEDELKFFINGNWLGSYYNINNGWQQWPYDQEFYIILNLAIGSHFMSCETENNLFPQRYEIDYVRVYQLQSIDDIELYGDLNLDNNLDVVDIILMVDYIVGNSNPSDQQFLIADMNQDGEINIFDVIQLVEEIL
tara:strand:- start:677 stop:2413 length:1737 start_codon:yes stop_codon:yes gene_type:complete